jgi:hypothetical protein
MVEKTYGLNLEARTESIGIAGLRTLKHTHPIDKAIEIRSHNVSGSASN